MGMESTLPCGIEDVVNMLGIRIIRNTGTQLHCRCPFCDDHKAHLNVRLDLNVFRCNRCGKGGGVLHLYALAHEVSLNTAYEELCRIFQADEKPREVPKKLTEAKVQKVETPLAESCIRNNTYSNLLSLLSLGATHRESLLMRGLSSADINRLGYRTTPAVRGPKIVTELLERGCVLDGVPGFYRDIETGRWKLDIRGSGIMIPDKNVNGEIEAIQIRLDRVTKSKYNNLTSVDKYYGTTAACCPHFVGVTADSECVYLTEGVLKADVAYCLANELHKTMAFVGLTGVGNINQFLRALDELSALGVKKIRVAFDMDDLTNDNVRNCKERIILAGLDGGYDITPMRWPTAYKGIDDLLLAFKQKAAGGEQERTTE